MKHSSLLMIALSLSLFGGFARPDAADACSYPADSITVRDTPVNGVVILDVMCAFGACFEGELPTELPIMDNTTGEMVDGELVHSLGTLNGNALIAWRPAAPLVAGHSYEVLWLPGGEQSRWEVDLEFATLDAAIWSAADIAVVASIALQEQPSATVECEAEDIFLCGPFVESYSNQVVLEQRLSVGLGVSIDSNSEPAGSSGQYLATIAIWGAGEAQPEPVVAPAFRYYTVSAGEVFETALDSYCYRVEVTSLIDGSVAVTEDCIEHDLGELTTRQVDDALITDQIGACLAPPEGYLEQWCDARKVRCAGGQTGSDMGCDTFAATCADVEPNEPSEPEPNEPSDPNDSMDMNEDPNDDDDALAPDQGLKGGCSAIAGGRGNAWPSAVFAGLLWVARAARKRRSSRVGD